MSELEIFSFPYGSFLKLRLEFVLLCDDDLQARIMRIIEGWMIDQKKKWQNEVAEAASQGLPEPPEPEYWCTLSYAQIITQLYKFNTSRGSGKKDKPNGKEVIEGKNNTITRVTVAAAMHALIDNKQYVRIRANPNTTKEYEASQYTLNVPLIQEHLKHLPKNAVSYLGSNGRINGIPCKDFLHPPEELISELGYEPRKKSLHEEKKEFTPHAKNSHVGDVKNSHHLIDIVIDPLKDKEIESITPASQNSDISHAPIGDVAPSFSFENMLTVIQGITDEQKAQLAQALGMGATQTMPPPAEKPAQPTLFEEENAPIPGGGSAQVVNCPIAPTGKGKGRGKKVVLTEEEQAEKERLAAEEEARKEICRQVYNNMVTRRGGEANNVVVENTYIKKLVLAGYTPEQIDCHHAWHETKDWRFNKPETQANVTAAIIFSVWSTTEIALKKLAKEAAGTTRNNAPSQKSSYSNSSAPSAHRAPTQYVSQEEQAKLFSLKTPEERRAYALQRRAERLQQQAVAVNG